jgi:hypothetical protein
MRRGIISLAVAVVVLVVAGPSFAGGTEQATAAPSLGSFQSGVIGSAASKAGVLSATTQGVNFNPGSYCSCSECLYLDIYDPSHTDSAPVGSPWVLGPVYTTNNLQAGKLYLVTVRGDVSYWSQTGPAPSWASDPGTWTGTPGNPPRYPSPATANGYTGFDWEYVFAVPYPFDDFPVPAHVPAEGISVDGGATFLDYVPVGGQVYHSDHTYQYIVVGQGKKAGFRTTDTGPTSDNSGRYKICVQLLTACGDIGSK